MRIGDKAQFTREITTEAIEMFVDISGDLNPIHRDDEYAEQTIFKGRIAPGIFVSGLISAVIANQLPGAGSIYLSQILKFVKPVRVHDFITAEIEVLKIDKVRNRVKLYTRCFNQNNENVIIGEAEVLLPAK